MWYSVHLLRAIAAILVVSHHASHYLIGRVGFDVPEFLQGAAGVDIFFLISGFVMHQATQKKNLTSFHFFRARLLRIVPMYWLSTVALASAALVLPMLFKTFSTTLDATVQSLLFLPVYDAKGVFRPVLQQGWTLQYEMLFYTLTALAIFVNSRRASLISSGFITAIALLLYASQINLHFSWLQIFAPIAIEFSLGVLLGYAFNSPFAASFQKRTAAPFIGLTLIVIGASIIASYTPTFVDLERLLHWGGGAFLIMIGALLLESFAKAFQKKIHIIGLLGDSSYVLYLIHGVAFSFASKIIPIDRLQHWLTANMALTCFAILLGILFHIYVEKPTNRLIHRALNQPG